MLTYYEAPYVSQGPEVPPLLPGLPHTPASACRELLLHVVVRGLIDGLARGETYFVMSRRFLAFCMYIGLEPETAAKIQAMFLRKQITAEPLEAILRGAYLRFGHDDDETRPAVWDSWTKAL
jgi:hypothetical protein